MTALRLLQTMSVPRIASRCHVTGLSVSVDIAEKKGSGLIAIYTRLSITYTVNIALFRMLLPPTVKERALLEAVGRRLLQPPTLRRRSRANASSITQSVGTYWHASQSIYMLWNSTIARKIPRGERRPNLHSDRCRSPAGGTFGGPEVFHCVKMSFLAWHCVRKPPISISSRSLAQLETSSHIFQILGQTYVLRLVWEWVPEHFSPLEDVVLSQNS